MPRNSTQKEQETKNRYMHGFSDGGKCLSPNVLQELLGFTLSPCSSIGRRQNRVALAVARVPERMDLIKTLGINNTKEMNSFCLLVAGIMTQNALWTLKEAHTLLSC